LMRLAGFLASCNVLSSLTTKLLQFFPAPY
jgi:hypothetical protein